MKYLLDTHTFLWFVSDDPSLSVTAKTFIEQPENALYVSAASIWEIAIKVSLKRLQIPQPFANFIDDQLRINAMEVLELKVAHLGVVAELPYYHRDPFDRLIIAQAISEQIPLLGRDSTFDDYGITRLW